MSDSRNISMQAQSNNTIWSVVSLYKVAILALYFTLLCLPVTQQFFRIFPDGNGLTENRKKIAMPEDFGNLFRLKGDFATRFESYFNDNYGFRDFLIKLYNQFNFSLFRDSSQVIVGKDGWLFYRQVYVDVTVTVEKSLDKLPKLFERLSKLNQNLKNRGIQLVVVPCPMKTTIYPEYLPENQIQRPEISIFSKYLSYLKETPAIESIDVTGQLLTLKQKQQVFHKTDFHWNDPAGALVMKSLIDRLGEISATTVTWNQPLEISITEPSGGGEINSLGVFFPPLERMLMVAKNPAAGVGQLFPSEKPNNWRYLADKASPEKLLPKTVLFGDSYADAFLRSGLTLPFSELQKFYNLEFKERLSEIPGGTKIVIFEHIESNLSAMLDDSYWPEELR